MTINQALKQKNVLAGKLVVLKTRIYNSNRFIKGETPSYNAATVLKEYQATQEAMIELKTQISTASTPIIGVIIKLAELKLFIAQFKALQVNKGLEASRYNSGLPLEYDVSITQLEKDELTDIYQQHILQFQEELDQFNAKTNI